MWRMIGVSTTGAMGFGISPVSGKSRVPLPAASTIAFIEVLLLLASSRSAESPRVNYSPPGAYGNFTPTLPHGQARRTAETVHGLEDRGTRRRSPGAFEHRRVGRDRRDRPRTRC